MKKTITTIAFGLLSLSLSAQVPSYIPTSGLLAWYPYNGNANDASGNSNTAVVTGATLTADRFGNASSAYSFNGTSDFITIPSTLNPGQLTISFWCKLNSNQTDQTIIRNRLYGYGVSYNLTPNTEKFSANLYLNSTNSYSAVVNDSVSLSKWYNVVFIYDGSNYKIYLDGDSVYGSNSLGAGSVYYSNGGNGFAIGRDGDNSARYFNGSVDDVGIWNRALTQQEISDLYNANICYQTVTVTDTLLINTGITGFNPITYKNTIKVWPNPTNDHITIDNGNIANLTGYQIKITNSLSQQVFQSAITQQQFYVDLSTWTGNGIYFVHIIDGQGNTIDIKKIILQ